MQKLPVVATYANVMRFAFGRFLTILRLSWLPIALLLAAIAAYFALQFSMIRGRFPHTMTEEDAAAGLQALVLSLEGMIVMQVTLLLLQAIAMSAVAVSIHRVILFGDTKPGVWFNFPFGATEIRFLAMGFLFALMTIGVIALLVGPVLLLVSGGDVVGFFADWPTKGQEVVRSGAFSALIGAYLIGWLTVLFLLVRLSVWPPSVVASGSLAPGEPWRLTRGNFWRLIGLFVLTGATLYALLIPFMIAFAVFMITRLRDLPAQGENLPPEAVLEMLQPALPFVAAFYFFLIVFVTGVTVALVSYSYKALKGYDARTPIAA